MDKIRIAIINSGIDGDYPAMRESLKGGTRIHYDKNGRIEHRGGYYFDIEGHGTAIAGMIKNICSTVEFYSVKILDKKLEGYGRVLVEAIKWAIKNRVQIINLSLGTSERKWASSLRKVCEQAIKNNIIIVAAGFENKVSYPAWLSKEVIGVTCGDWKNNGDCLYSKNSKIEFRVKRKKIKVPMLDGNYRIKELSPSFAAAQITGIIANLILGNPSISLDEIRRTLIRKCIARE